LPGGKFSFFYTVTFLHLQYLFREGRRPEKGGKKKIYAQRGEWGKQTREMKEKENKKEKTNKTEKKKNEEKKKEKEKTNAHTPTQIIEHMSYHIHITYTTLQTD
jgi:hypothetical protein